MQIMLGNYDDGLENLKKSYDLDKNEIKSFDVIMETCEFDKSKLLNKIKNYQRKIQKKKLIEVWLEEINALEESNIDLSEVITDKIT